MNSWDCFDTLIARRYFKPKTVFAEVGKRLGIDNFVEQRVAAERASNKTYQDIYARLPGIDPQVELDVELEHNFPIMENILKVKDGDLILSDMYLPADFVMKLLRNCGLTADVDIIVTPDGKKRGWIWKEVKEKYNIDNHYGDNEKSDVISAHKHNVNGILDTKTHFTKHEQEVSKRNKHLALWMRYTRLMCPYSDKDSQLFWLDQANLNLPLLALTVKELPDTPIAFTYRDCVYLHPLYEAMIGRQGRRLDTSREMYNNPTEEFKKYFYEVTKDATIVDLQGTGQRIYNFTDGNPPPTIYVAGKTRPFVKRLVENNTKSLEKHNCTTIGPIVAWNNGPVRGTNDHNEEVALIQHKAMHTAIDATVWFNNIKNDLETLDYVVNHMRSKNFTHSHLSWSRDNSLKNYIG